MYIWICMLIWCVYGTLVISYILHIDDPDIKKVNPSSAVILTIVAGPVMWAILGMAYLSSYLGRWTRGY